MVGSNLRDDRTLILKYNPYRQRELANETRGDMVSHLKNLWGYNVIIR